MAVKTVSKQPRTRMYIVREVNYAHKEKCMVNRQPPGNGNS